MNIESKRGKKKNTAQNQKGKVSEEQNLSS